MAIVKNQMIRVGADLSGLVSGFRVGAKAMGGFSKNAKKEAQATAAALEHIKHSMAQGSKNEDIVSLVDQIAELEADLKAAGEAGFGWGFESFENDVRLLRDLKTKLNEYVAGFNEVPDGPKQWVAQLREMGHQSQQLDSFVAKLQASVDASQPLGAQLNAAKSALKEMEAAGLGMGDAAWDDMYMTVSRLTREAKDYKDSLNGVGNETDQVRKKTSKIGVVAKAAGSGLKKLLSKIGSIGSRARSSTGGVEKLLRSIRRIGIVSLGLRFVKSIFGELSSIVHEYIAENATLKAQTDALKSSMGQALAPAINVVIKALSALMPYVIGLSNAIGSLIGNLFGGGWAAVSDGAKSAAEATMGAAGAQKEYNRTLAGFDEINKINAQHSSGGGGGGGVSAGTTTPIEGKLPAWLTDFSSKIKEAISNKDFFGLGEILAEELGHAVDKAREFLNSPGFTGKLEGLTSGFTDSINGFFEKITFSDGSAQTIANKIGALIGEGAALAVATIGDFLNDVNWDNVGIAIGQGLNGAIKSWNESGSSVFTMIGQGFNSGVSTLAASIEEIDWAEVTKALTDGLINAILEIDWKNIASLFTAGAGALQEAACGIFASAIPDGIEEAPGLVSGMMSSLTDGVKSMGYEDDAAKNSYLTGIACGAMFAAGMDKAYQSNAKLPKWAERLLKLKASVDVEANVVKTIPKGNMAFRMIPVRATAVIESVQDKLRNKQLSFLASITSWRESLSKKTINGFAAKIGSWKENLTNKTIPGFVANVVSWKESLPSKTINGFLANLSSWKDGLVDKTVSFAAKVNSWNDNLGDKILEFKANVQKGWSGSLAKVLGIETITSSLRIKAPKISIEWGETTIGGITIKFPKGFNVKWNAKGGIMNSAAIFGGYGNTLFGGGEAGREAILPLDRNTGWMDKIADRMVQRIVHTHNGEQNITIQLVLDGKVITQTVVRNVNAQARATGVHPMAAYM